MEKHYHAGMNEANCKQNLFRAVLNMVTLFDLIFAEVIFFNNFNWIQSMLKNILLLKVFLYKCGNLN